MAESFYQLNTPTTTGDRSSAWLRADNGNKTQEVVLQTQTGTSDPVSINSVNPLPVTGNVGSGTADAGNPISIAGVFNSSAPTFANGQRGVLQLDAAGNLKINIVAGAAAGGTSSNFGAAFPGSGTALGALNSAGTLMAALNLDAGGNLKVNVASGSIQAVTDNTTAFTAGSSQGLPLAFAFNDSASAATSGDFAIPRITANRQIRVVQDASTNGGLTFYSAIQPATPANTVIKASAGQLGFVHATNNNATPVYIKLFNLPTGSVTLGTTACSVQFEVPGNTAGAGFTVAIPQGLAFTTAMTMATTGAIASTDNTVIAANSVIVNFGYA